MAEQQQNDVKISNIEMLPGMTEQYEIFNLVLQNGQVFIAIGNHIVTRNNFASVEDAKAYIDAKPWDLLVNTTCLIYDITNELKKKEKTARRKQKGTTNDN